MKKGVLLLVLLIPFLFGCSSDDGRDTIFTNPPASLKGTEWVSTRLVTVEGKQVTEKLRLSFNSADSFIEEESRVVNGSESLLDVSMGKYSYAYPSMTLLYEPDQRRVLCEFPYSDELAYQREGVGEILFKRIK